MRNTKHTNEKENTMTDWTKLEQGEGQILFSFDRGANSCDLCHQNGEYSVHGYPTDSPHKRQIKIAPNKATLATLASQIRNNTACKITFDEGEL